VSRAQDGARGGAQGPAPGRPAVDVVLFDLGNVLVQWDPYLPYRGTHSREEVDRFLVESDFWALNSAQDAGEPWASVRERLGRTRPDLVPMLDVYVTRYAEALPGEVPGAAELVRDVRAVGLRAYGLTNWGAETWPLAAERAPVVRLLEGVVVSGHERLAKPDPEIYRRAVARFGLDPARTLFTDDAERNVAAAARLGFRTHLFTGHDGLRAALAALGVRLGRDS